MKRECRIQAVEQKAQNMMQDGCFEYAAVTQVLEQVPPPLELTPTLHAHAPLLGSGPDNTTARGPPAQSSSGSRQPHEVALSHLLAISVVQPNSRDMTLAGA